MRKTDIIRTAVGDLGMQLIADRFWETMETQVRAFRRR